MFNAFEYFETIYQNVKNADDLPIIGKIYRVSGLSAFEEVLSDLKNNPDCCLVVRDSGDGFLNIKDQRFNKVYHTIYIMAKTKLNDHGSRMAAKRLSHLAGVKLFDLMKLDARDFGDAAFGFDDSRIDYAEIGPLGANYYGYEFSFSIGNYFA